MKRIPIFLLLVGSLFAQNNLNAPLSVSAVNGTGGTTFQSLAILTGTTATAALTTSTTVPLYIVTSPTNTNTGAQVFLAAIGIVPCAAFDGAFTATPGTPAYVVASTTNAGQCHAVNAPLAAGQGYAGFLASSPTSTGQPALVSVNPGTWQSLGSGAGTVTSSGYSSGSPLAAFSASTNITPATYLNVIALWSSCSGSQLLGFDGTCYTVGGTGTVTGVTAGTGLTGSPSTITTSGTISLASPVTTALGGTGTTSTLSGLVLGGNPFTSLHEADGTVVYGISGAWSTSSSPNISIGGNAATASTATIAVSLASLPSNCGAGSFAIGILANGNATGCMGAGHVMVTNAGTDAGATIAAFRLAAANAGSNAPIVDLTPIATASVTANTDMFANDGGLTAANSLNGVVIIGGTLQTDIPIAIPQKTRIEGVSKGDSNSTNSAILADANFHTNYPAIIIAAGANSTICVRANTANVYSGTENSAGTGCDTSTTPGPNFTTIGGGHLGKGYAVYACPNGTNPTFEGCIPIGVVNSVTSSTLLVMERNVFSPFAVDAAAGYGYQVAFIAPVVRTGLQGTGCSSGSCSVGNQQQLRNLTIDCNDSAGGTDQHLGYLNYNGQELDSFEWGGIRSCAWGPGEVVTSQTHNSGPYCHITIGSGSGGSNANTGGFRFWNWGTSLREVCDMTNVQGSHIYGFEFVNAQAGITPSGIAWGLHAEGSSKCTDAVRLGNTTAWPFATNGYGVQNFTLMNETGNGAVNPCTNGVHILAAGTVGALTESTAVHISSSGDNYVGAGTANILDDYTGKTINFVPGQYVTGPNGYITGTGLPSSSGANAEATSDFCPSIYLRQDGADATTLYISNCNTNTWAAH